MNKSQTGFMQGRLSPLVDGKIQAFPVKHWRDEFPLAQKLGLSLMEWTLDHHNLSDNPLMSPSGREEIRRLSLLHNIGITSLTGDCFMQAPFWKERRSGARNELLAEFDSVVEAATDLGIGIIVIPLVDNGRIESADEAAILRSLLQDRLTKGSLRVAFESDLPPQELAQWISEYPSDRFGVNYDTGNSASLGFDPIEEWTSYGNRVINVHIKDRKRGGTTVPLSEGACEFQKVFRMLHQHNYSGNLILQTARAADGNHFAALERYKDFVDTLQ